MSEDVVYTYHAACHVLAKLSLMSVEDRDEFIRRVRDEAARSDEEDATALRAIEQAARAYLGG